MGRQAKEQGVRRAHQRVVDLEVGERLDAVLAGVLERSGIGQRGERAAVTVGREEDAVAAREQDAAVEVERRQHARRSP